MTTTLTCFIMTSGDESRMSRVRADSVIWVLTTAVLTAAATAAEWPAFLPPASRFSASVVVDVESAFGAPTLKRTVTAKPAPVPLRTYLGFVDAPDITAAAARHLGLARYEVEMLGPNAYRADDKGGNRGWYSVLEREGGRRVILSWGAHEGSLTGTIRGHALSVLEFEDLGDQTAQTISAWVRIDSGTAAAIVRALAPIFGYVIDRKLTEGFEVTARVAEWALEHPAEFCDWLQREPSLGERRGDVPDGLPACPTAAVQSTVSPRR